MCLHEQLLEFLLSIYSLCAKLYVVFLYTRKMEKDQPH